MKTIKMKIMAVASLFALALTANAAGFSNIFVFGDSLSDNGNLNSVNPAAPERFTNGPVALEITAAQLGLSLTPSFHLTGPVQGNNFAVAGAVAIDEDGDESTPDINLPTQVNAFLQSVGGAADPAALYVILIGGNDVRAAREISAEGIIDTNFFQAKQARFDAVWSIKEAVESEVAQIAKLVAAGAQNILVVNVPDIGAIPDTDVSAAAVLAQADTAKEERKANRLPRVATKLTAKYNHILARKVNRLERNTGFNLIEYDLFEFLSNQIENAEDFGLTNTDDACIFLLQGGIPNPECDFPFATGFLFFDEIHPTAPVHQAAGIEILQTLLAQ